MSARGEGELVELFHSLDATGREMLLELARCLHTRHAAPPPSGEPLDIPRPASETVVAAIRRLSRTYPMLDADDLLHGAADLVSQHVMGARPAAAVIDELQTLFARRYEAWRSEGAGDEND